MSPSWCLHLDGRLPLGLVSSGGLTVPALSLTLGGCLLADLSFPTSVEPHGTHTLLVWHTQTKLLMNWKMGTYTVTDFWHCFAYNGSPRSRGFSLGGSSSTLTLTLLPMTSGPFQMGSETQDDPLHQRWRSLVWTFTWLMEIFSRVLATL